MRKITVFLIMISFLITSISIRVMDPKAEAEKPLSAGNILYVDDDGGSTYTNVNAALQDVSPGDTINIAPGTYYMISVANKENLTIIGNNSAGEVTVYGGNEILPVWFIRSANITMYGFTFDGLEPAAGLRKCQNITFAFNRFQSRGGMDGAVMVEESDDVSIIWSLITSNVGDLYGIELDNLDNFTADGVIFEMTGLNSGVIEAVNCNNVILDSVNGTYSGFFLDAQSSTVTTIDTVVPDAFVSVDGSSQLDVEFFRRVIVKEEDNSTKLGDVEFELRINNAPVYQTSHYGGTDAVSNVDGIFPTIPNLVQKRFAQSSTPSYLTNAMKFYYDGLDASREVDLGEVDAGTSDELHVIFPDMRQPEPPENVKAETVDEYTINISFDASPSKDVDHYEIWQNVSSEWVKIMNEIIPGNFSVDSLESGTFHEFRVRALDDAGFNSSWVLVGNRTDEATEGTINGTLVYSGGPLNRTAVVNATVMIGNSTANLTAVNSTDEFGFFDLGTHWFRSGYVVLVSPPEFTIDGGVVSGYLNTSMVIDHFQDTVLSFEVPYYEYIPIDVRRLEGHVHFENGPLRFQDPTNVTIHLFNETLVEIRNLTVNETGDFYFDRIPIGYNYTLWAVPVDEVEWNGTESGYVKKVFEFEFRYIYRIEMDLSYYYNEPVERADIYGRVVYSGGPKDGEGASNARIVLTHLTSLLYNYEVRSNTTGHYRFEDMFLESTYTFFVTPNEDDHGEEGYRSGYQMTHFGPFDHFSGDHEEIIFVEYFGMGHPSATILNDEGDPIPEVVIVMAFNGTKYIAMTDENGVAEFDEFDGTEFPDGATFVAAKDGYEDLEWAQGEEIPQMVEDNGEKPNNLILYLIIGLIIILVIVVLLFLLRKSGVEEEEYTEE